MSAFEEMKFWFAYFYGKNAKLNLFGQVLFTPFIVPCGIFLFVFEFLFTKR